MIIEDVVISVPAFAWDVVLDYSARAREREWLEHLEATVPSIRGGGRYLARGARFLVSGLDAKVSRWFGADRARDAER